MAKLQFFLDDGETIEVPLSDDITIGRIEGNDVVVDDPRISSRHAEIHRLPGGGFEVRDLASKAGTFVNDERVDRRVLVNGDCLNFGPLKAGYEAGGLEPTIVAPAAELETSVAPLPTRKGKAKTVKSTKKGRGEKIMLPANPDPSVDSEALVKPGPDDEAVLAQLQQAKLSLEKDTEELRRTLAPLAEEHRELGRRCAEMKNAVASEERRLENLRAQVSAGETQFRTVTGQIHAGQERLAALKTTEERLGIIQRETAEAETRRSAVLEALAQLVPDFESKKASLSAEFSRLVAEVEAERGALEAGLKQHASETAAKRAALDAELARAQAESDAQKRAIAETMAALSNELALKQAEVHRLSASAESTLRELEVMAANKEAMSVQMLGLLKEQEGHEARLIELRRQIADTDSKLKGAEELCAAREDQVSSAERRLQALEKQRHAAEQRLAELGGAEERLRAAQTKLQESETQHAAMLVTLASVAATHRSTEEQTAALNMRIESLKKDQAGIEDAISATRSKLAEEERALAAFLARAASEQAAQEEAQRKFRADAEAERSRLQAEAAALSETLDGHRNSIATATRHIGEAQAKLAGLQQQARDLVETEGRLTEARANLQKSEAKRTELDAWIKDLEAKRDAAQKVLDGLHQEEEAGRGRLEVLRGREKDLRSTLDELAERERSDRGRFEEIRRLTAEAEKEHAKNMEELQRTTELSRRELADLELKLAPLREWKDAMDKRYERLASLPEDSTEARELWKEIESEKAGLRSLITERGKGTRGITLSEAVLRGLTSSEEVPESAEPPKPAKTGRGTAKKGKLHAPEPVIEPQAGVTGTGAMLSATGQEMALKARLNRMRESVQREATRLEYLRQERAREETRGKAGTTAGETMLREQERQLEAKVRREEEKLAAIERKIELSEMEEEKRRDRIAEMERRLSELKADIAEHERTRGDAVRGAELARKELESMEDAVERLKTMGEGDDHISNPVAGPASGGEARSKLKTLVSGPPGTKA